MRRRMEIYRLNKMCHLPIVELTAEIKCSNENKLCESLFCIRTQSIRFCHAFEMRISLYSCIKTSTHTHAHTRIQTFSETASDRLHESPFLLVLLIVIIDHELCCGIQGKL